MVRKFNSPFCQPIDIGSFNHFPSVTTKFKITHIISQNVNNIGFIVLFLIFLTFGVVTKQNNQQTGEY
jgi:hypothetical protein